jgi:hypothetical protein
MATWYSHAWLVYRAAPDDPKAIAIRGIGEAPQDQTK